MNSKSKIILQFFSLTLLLLCVFLGNKKEVNIERWEMAEKTIPSKDTHGFVQETQEEVKVSLVPGKEALSPVIQKVTEPYTKLLINYDRVLHYPSYNRGDGTGWGIDENMVYDRVLRHVGKESNEVVYAIVDLAGDGEAELLIGEYWNDSIYRPFIIYGNIQGKISPGLIAEEYLINLYKGGIIEVIAGKAMFGDFRYYKMKRNSADLENIVNLWGDRVDITSDEYIYYSDEVEISKEEFEDIRKELTNQPLEINWQPLQGFWQGE